MKRPHKSADKVHKSKRKTQTRQQCQANENFSPDKAVSFSNKVKVREFGSKSRKRGKSTEARRSRKQERALIAKDNNTPSQAPNQMYGSFMPSVATAAETN